MLLSSSIVWGQKNADDDSVGIFSSQAEYSRFMGEAKRAAYGEDGNAELRAMIPMLNDIALAKPVGWTAEEYGATGSTLGLLSNKNIRQELEMVDGQYKELQDLSQQIQRRSADQIRQLDFSDRENLVVEINKIREQAIKDMNSVLLPHQLDRLRQIRMQALLQRQSLVDVITSEPVKSDLNVTEQQEKELKDFEKVVREDLAKEIAKLQEKARDRLLSKLEPGQKKQAKEMIGEAFAFQNQDSNKNNRKRKTFKAKPKGGKTFK
ncbi:MAG: hypothetical protein P8J27_15495 [Mariniblastus sp.]|nr:hypothetical protein [Mariniblastus sp.]